MTETTYLAAQCRCGAGGYLAPADAEYALKVLQYKRPQIVAGAVPTAAPDRTLRVATHEASHAAMVHVLGHELLSITADGQAHCLHAAIGSHIDRAAIALAGGHGERLIIERCEFRPYDDAVLETFNIVRALRMGGCDQCNAALAMFGYCGFDPSDADLLATYRRVEAATIDFLREPVARAVIRKLADRLMEIGTVDGAAAHRLIETSGVEFGSRRITI
ncbi:hypothetical protein [Hyphomicrobium nitrativorans]|uniref:hypothetical protein n=1 Tax=Hyphomicrobium nitrativorans TaxID=1427356 RepID=UPI000A49EB84|nr:hypothetical protein [Hyphomicrobium nitrativorans]